MYADDKNITGRVLRSTRGQKIKSMYDLPGRVDVPKFCDLLMTSYTDYERDGKYQV